MGKKSNVEDRVHELLDIIVHEVSDVDRAANKRRYLAIKSDYGVEVIEKDDGSLTLAKRDDESAPDAEIDLDQKKQSITLPGPVKQALMRTTREALERLMGVVNRIRDATETDEKLDNPTPDALARDMRSVAGLLTAALKRYPAPMAKRGAKLSKKRREQLKAVIGLLQKILDEVMPAKSAPSGAPAGVRDIDPNKANVGSGTQPDKAATGDALSVLSDAPGLKDVLKQVEELSTTVKKQADELFQLRKAAGAPASRQVEKGGRSRRRAKKPDRVAWPLDMNNEVTRESVDKNVSFYDLD